VSHVTKEKRVDAIQSRTNSESERIQYMINYMEKNKAFLYARDTNKGNPDTLLKDFRGKYLDYRKKWREQPHMAIEKKIFGEKFHKSRLIPLCVDIETAAICDLACPFCYRQWIATPDKLMDEKLAYSIIRQCSQMGIPSLKLNWRGEPLLHPRLADFIDFAKKGGILETIINSNAVTLNENRSAELIKSGLDLLIYSFDGGSQKTYEKMRVGRFKTNRFEKVYNNIRNFAKMRRKMNSPFPRTKIQMILTEETFDEQDSFFDMFRDYVDDISVKAYSERGGQLSELPRDLKKNLDKTFNMESIPQNAGYWRDMQGTVFIAIDRLPCEQPFQRLMISYDGRVSMCCYDWGISYPVGYVDDRAFQNDDRDSLDVIEKARKKSKGYELLENVRMPERHILIPQKIQTLDEIWNGDVINHLRKMHLENRVSDVPVCRRCTFKDTYTWINTGVNS